MKALADEVYDELGHLDILVNNAGVTMRPFRAVWDAAPSDFEWMMRINLEFSSGLAGWLTDRASHPETINRRVRAASHLLLSDRLRLLAER